MIPTYNRRHYLTEAIDSAIAQDTGDIEIIVVDDGSTDDTPSIADIYGDRIRYVRTEHRGFIAARNTGMQLARGEYLALLDDDDQYYPYKLRLQAALLDQRRDIGMVYTEFSAFSTEGFWDECHLQTYHKSAYRQGNIRYASLFEEDFRLPDLWRAPLPPADPLQRWADRRVYVGDIYEPYLFNTIVFTNSMMFRRDLLATTGLQRSRYGFFHDLEFALRLCKHARVAFVDVPTYRLRYHPQQVSTIRRHNGELVAIRKQRDLLRVTRDHALRNAEYYNAHRRTVERQLARLCRAVAVPLLAHASVSPRVDRRFARRARLYVARSRGYGYPERLLWLLSFSPHLLRRLVFKWLTIWAAGKHAVRGFIGWRRSPPDWRK